MVLHLFSGCPASGKTTYASKVNIPLLEFDTFVTSYFCLPLAEAMKKYVDSRDTVYKKYIEAIVSLSRSGDCGVTDTLTLRSERAEILANLHEQIPDCKFYMYYFLAPVDMLLKRNAARANKINEVTVTTMFFRQEIPSTKEGFDKMFLMEYGRK